MSDERPLSRYAEKRRRNRLAAMPASSATGPLELEIPGAPVAKERPRVGKGGRVFTPRKTRDYEEKVAWIARLKRRRFSGPVAVEISLYTERRLRGDIDNYAKALLDGLEKGALLENDRQVVSLAVHEGTAPSKDLERVVVVISPREVAA